MGNGAGRTPAQWTTELWNIIDSDAFSVHTDLPQIRTALENGAYVTVPNRQGLYMYPIVRQKRDRNATARNEYAVAFYDQLIAMLSQNATALLAKLVVDENGRNINDIILLATKLGADCYQGEKYGPLGLLGEILKKKTATRQLVELLIQNDEQARLGLGKQEGDISCMDLAKVLDKTDVIDYLQLELNKLLNKMPFERNGISAEDIYTWIVSGADTEWKDAEGETVLCKAVEANRLELCKALVAAGANTSCQNKHQQTLVEIVRSKTPVNAQLLQILESRAIIDELKLAIINHDSVNDIQAILSRGADLNRINNARQETFLHLLILNHGSPDMVKMFVNDYKADIKAMNIKGYRAIETVIVCDSDEETTCSILMVLFRLKQFTTDLFYNEKLKQSILSFCDHQKRKPEVKKLIQKELNQRLYQLCQSSNDETEPNEEKERKIIEELTKLIQYGAQIDHQQPSENYGQWTIVHFLCKLGKLKFLQYVIETLKATSYNEKTESGDYPISIAAEYGHQSIVHYLRETFDQISLNVSNSNGDTPLHKAAKNNHFLVVRYLVQWGADPQAVNNFHQTPLALVSLSENNRTMAQFLEQFNHIPDEQSEQTRPRSALPLNDNFDFAQLVIPIVLDAIYSNFETSPESNRSGFLEDSPNQKLFRAAENGSLPDAQNAIAHQADVRYLNNRQSSYAKAVEESRKYQYEKLKAGYGYQQQVCVRRINEYNQVADYLADIATTNIKETIKQGNAGLTVAYHQCGAKITPDLLEIACQNNADSKETVDYLVTRDPAMLTALFSFNHGNKSLYSMALEKKKTNIANYIKWKLTEQLINAVKENNAELVKKLLLAGASANMQGQQTLDQAIQQDNIAMVRALCEHSARFPSSNVNIDNPEIKSILKRYELNHEFRKAAASGKLSEVIRYHRQSADINAENCHGATALLVTLQSGEYYPIVYYLVSCGASMVHSDVTQPSVIHLAEKRKYQKIFAYLSEQLNRQFLSTFLDNDTSKTKALAQLGTNFNCTDEEGRTPLHYAVQYHGTELVKWLCDCGSNPTIADNNGNYPITQAAEKGDYAVIEYFIREHGATKPLKNKQGLDVLAIAKKKRFNEIVQLLDPGNPDFQVPKKSKISEPKHTNERLDRAVRNSEIQIIQEFIGQEYQSLKEKTEQCAKMIEIAKQETQYQVLSMLQPHYAELSKELNSNQAADKIVHLGKRQLSIFYGFMDTLSDLITGNHVTLDPENPQTHHDLIAHMLSTDKKRSQDIQSIRNQQDSEQFCQRELNSMQDKIEHLNKNLGQMKLEKQKLTDDIQKFEKQLNDNNVSAIDKKKYFEDKQTIEDALNALESSIELSRHAHETALNKKKLLDYIKTTPELFVFYATIEHRLQSLFIGVLAAQSELLKTELSTGAANVGSAIVENAPLELIPVVGAIMGPVKGATKGLIEKLDKHHQKAQWYNISVLGNIEELQKAASRTAGLLTLYYNQQIQLIDTTSSKVQGSNIFSTAVTTIDTFIEGTPEPENERTIVLVAEFLSEFIIDTLKSQNRKEKNEQKKPDNPIVPDKPLAEQLWLFVAKENFLELSRLKSFLAKTGFGLAKRVILIRKSIDRTYLPVQVRQLFGCASLITGDGRVYLAEVDADEEAKIDDIEGIFGYVYLDPFIADDTTIIDKICKDRKLKKLDGNNVDKAASLANEKMIEGVRTLKEVLTDSGSHGGVTKRMALSIGKVLEDKKVFLTKDELDSKLNKHQKDISYDVNSLRDEMKDSTKKFQTSIDAAYEKIGQDFDECTHKLQCDNREQYQKSVQKINEQQKQLEERLEKSNTTRLNRIEDDLKKKSDNMMTIATNAQQESQTAVRISKVAEDLSVKCEQKATIASEKAEALVASTDQRKQEMQKATNDCVDKVQKTIDEQKQTYETSLNVLHKQVKKDAETWRTAAITANQRADDAERRAREVAEQMEQLIRDHRREIETLKRQKKEEIDRLVSIQEKKVNELIESQNKERSDFADAKGKFERAIEQTKNEATNAANEAKRAAEASEKALKKTEK